jgi:RNA polymerase sigma-70 factor (ECF subfamily)
MDELIPTRATLIERLKDWQDQSSWQDFFDTYWRLIYDIARKGGLTGAEAEDVVQETMISVAKHMPSFRYDPAIGSFKAWLLNMTRWRMTDQLRRRGPLAAADSSFTDESGSDESAGNGSAAERVVDENSQELEALWNAEWEKNLLKVAMARVRRRVDPQKYQIFDLYVNKGWASEKVAATFEVPVDQVYLVKHRVTEMIKAEVKRLETEML